VCVWCGVCVCDGVCVCVCVMVCNFSLCRLFFVIECVNGGDLMFHMQRHRRLPEEHARFYSSEIACALNYLHERGEYLITMSIMVI